MSEKPILMNTEMVQMTLKDLKTQTRRVIKPQPVCDLEGAYFDSYNGGPQWNWWLPDGRLCNDHDIIKCPYGKPGDELWVRETWRIYHGTTSAQIYYKASADNTGIQVDFGYAQMLKINPRWRPSIHMPRWASRIQLRITDIRVERIQDITEEDAIEEGLTAITKDGSLYKYGIPDNDGLPGTDNHGWPWNQWEADPRKAFFKLIDSINGKRGFLVKDNYWLWVIKFERIKP